MRGIWSRLRWLLFGGKDDRFEVVYLGEVEVLRVRPGDRLILTCDALVTRQQMEMFRDELVHFAGGEVPVAVLDASCSLAVVSLPSAVQSEGRA